MPAMFRQLHSMMAVAAAFAAFVCLALAAMSREDTDGTVHSRLEELWMRVDAREKSGESRGAALIFEAIRMISAFLDRIFGESLISVRSVIIVACCSIASVFVELLRVHFFSGPTPKEIGEALLLVAAGVLPMVRKERWALPAACIIPLLILTHEKAVDPEFLVGAAFSFVYIATIRKLLRLAIQYRGTYVVGAVLASGLLAIAAFAPVVNYASFAAVSGYFGNREYAIGTVGVCLLSNLLGGLVALAVFLLTALAINHRLIWPMLSRPAYRLQHHKVMLMYTFGAVLLLSAAPELGRLLRVD